MRRLILTSALVVAAVFLIVALAADAADRSSQTTATTPTAVEFSTLPDIPAEICGGVGQGCCPGNQCAGGLICSFGKCQREW